MRTASILENYNGLLLKSTNNKKILTWPEYVNLLINEENKYKKKIIKYISNPLEKNDNVNVYENIKNETSINNVTKNYFFKWKDNSCRYDSFCFILVYKLIYLFKDIRFKNYKLYDNLKEFSDKILNATYIDLNKGFFQFYEELEIDYLNIKNKITLKYI